MSDALAKRRELVARAKRAGIPHGMAMKMKSAELEETLARQNIVNGEPDMTSAPDLTVVPNTAPNADPEAPYGRKADGTPKAKPGRKTDGTSPAAPRPVKSRNTPRASRATASPDYRAGIAGLVQVPTAMLAVAGRFNPTLAYDAAAVVAVTPQFAEAVQAIAQEDPRIAALLDKVLTFGPYGALVGVVVTLGAQLAVNHGKIPVAAGVAFGAVDPDTLLGSVGTPAPPAAA